MNLVKKGRRCARGSWLTDETLAALVRSGRHDRWSRPWALLSGCVSQDAGYQDVRKVVASRTGHDVRWGHLEGDSASQDAVRQLLAKPLTAENAVKVALLNSAELQAASKQLRAGAGRPRQRLAPAKSAG
jgi:hypothetical protein